MPQPDELRTSVREPVDDASPALDWTVALAAGEGVRIADYVVRRFGRRIPKQYCCLLGNRSMLEHTLERLNKLTPPSRTLTVIGTEHAELAAPQLAGRSDHVVRQPGARDTGVALFVALAMIKRWHPGAVVTVTPTDHYVVPSARYVDHVRMARAAAAQRRDAVIVLGAAPREPEPELGYLTVGAQLSDVPVLRQVTGVVEATGAGDGALCNTMVACGSVDALWELGRASEPQLIDILDSFVPLVGTRDETDALEYIYRAILPVSLSRDVFARAPERLAVLPMTGVEWSDWARPERIESAIEQALATRRARGLVPNRAFAP